MIVVVAVKVVVVVVVAGLKSLVQQSSFRKVVGGR